MSVSDSVPDMPVMTEEIPEPEPDDILSGVMQTEFRELDGFDRCDKRFCNAQAMVIAVKPNVGELVFCGHHGREAQPSLIGAGFVSDDQQPRLAPVITTGLTNQKA